MRFPIVNGDQYAKSRQFYTLRKRSRFRQKNAAPILEPLASLPCKTVNTLLYNISRRIECQGFGPVLCHFSIVAFYHIQTVAWGNCVLELILGKVLAAFFSQGMSSDRLSSAHGLEFERFYQARHPNGSYFGADPAGGRNSAGGDSRRTRTRVRAVSSA